VGPDRRARGEKGNSPGGATPGESEERVFVNGRVILPGRTLFDRFSVGVVLALELPLQEGDAPVLVVTGSAGARREGGGGVLKELLPPAIEPRGADVVLVAEIGDGRMLPDMKPRDGDLLPAREALRVFLSIVAQPLKLILYINNYIIFIKLYETL
jgi:hypothetical protein